MFRFETLKSLIPYRTERPHQKWKYLAHSLTGLQCSVTKKHSGNSLVPRVVLAARFFHFGGKSVEAPALLLLLLTGALHTALHTTPPLPAASIREGKRVKQILQQSSQAKEPTNQRSPVSNPPKIFTSQPNTPVNILFHHIVAAGI